MMRIALKMSGMSVLALLAACDSGPTVADVAPGAWAETASTSIQCDGTQDTTDLFRGKVFQITASGDAVSVTLDGGAVNTFSVWTTDDSGETPAWYSEAPSKAAAAKDGILVAQNGSKVTLILGFGMAGCVDGSGVFVFMKRQ